MYFSFKEKKNSFIFVLLFVWFSRESKQYCNLYGYTSKSYCEKSSTPYDSKLFVLGAAYKKAYSQLYLKLFLNSDSTIVTYGKSSDGKEFKNLFKAAFNKEEMTSSCVDLGGSYYKVDCTENWFFGSQTIYYADMADKITPLFNASFEGEEVFLFNMQRALGTCLSHYNDYEFNMECGSGGEVIQNKRKYNQISLCRGNLIEKKTGNPYLDVERIWENDVQYFKYFCPSTKEN